jgi:hypothetical protein
MEIAPEAVEVPPDAPQPRFRATENPIVRAIGRVPLPLGRSSAGTEPEEVMPVVGSYHAAMGELIDRYEATVGWFAGDGLMVWFNDPIPCDEPAARAVRMAVEMRDAMSALTAAWRKRGHELDFSMGVALGYATIGRIGFEGRYDYGAVGSVLISPRVFATRRSRGRSSSARVYSPTWRRSSRRPRSAPSS